jgi:hypothetical protein
VAFDQKSSGSNKQSEKAGGGSPQQATNYVPASFNPIVRLEWPAPEKLYIKTAYVRLRANETINTFQRWHIVNLSPQAALLK